MFYTDIKFMLDRYFDGEVAAPNELLRAAKHIHNMGGYDHREYQMVVHAIENHYDLIKSTFSSIKES